MNFGLSGKLNRMEPYGTELMSWTTTDRILTYGTLLDVLW